MKGISALTLAERAYELLLLIYPAEFRHEYGPAMTEVFRTQWERRTSLHGRRAWLKILFRTLIDVLESAARQRFGYRHGASSSESGLPEGPRRKWSGSGSFGDWLGDFAQDLRFALRSLAKTPAFTLIAILSLAVGIGVNTAFFTVTSAVWVRPVPGVNGTDRMVEVLSTSDGREFQEWSTANFRDVREQTWAVDWPIDELAGYKTKDGSLITDGSAERVRVMYATENYFGVVGVTPFRGRGFLPDENGLPGQHMVAVVSFDMWQERFGGVQDIVGRTITLNRDLYTVVGVTPEEFKGHRALEQGTDVWVLLAEHPFLAADEYTPWMDRAAQWILTVGRLRPGATIDGANAALDTVFARLERDYPESNEGMGARAKSFGPFPAMNREADMIMLAAMIALVGLVLLIICGNVAGMVLARCTTREQEIAVRMALGSSRGRVVRHLMVETLVLAAVGGTLGILMAFWGTAAISARFASPIVVSAGLRPSAEVLGVSIALTLATAIVFGLFPALRFSRPDLVSSLKDDAGSGGRRVSRVHQIAASAQTGVALLFLVIGGLFLRAVVVNDQKDLGFEPQNLFVVSAQPTRAAPLDLALEGYQTLDEVEVFMRGLRESVASLPGVTSMSFSDGIPLDLVGNFTRVSRADRPDEEGGQVFVEFTRITEDFFPTIGTPILRGRGVEFMDQASSEPVAVITQALADQLWPEEDALGRRLRFRLAGESKVAFTVIGIVGRVGTSQPSRDEPHVFVALRQQFQSRILVAVRGDSNPAVLAESLRSAVAAADSGLPVPPIVTSESLVARSTESQKLSAAAASGLGVLALILSAIGVYGVIAFAVANRTREIGLRMALGATRERILGAILVDAVRLALPGLLVGIFLAAGLAVVIRSELFGLAPLDPISFGVPMIVLFAVVLLASLLPARRASGIQPMDALRSK